MVFHSQLVDQPSDIKFLTEDRIPVIESLVRLVDIGPDDSHRPPCDNSILRSITVARGIRRGVLRAGGRYVAAAGGLLKWREKTI